ncbi:Eco29kI family restriction endonuclease [Streptomyces sp. NPDC018031]|uniref:Eco29kI family restriction endonuclease n=1 Tax=Streptomyces sp. NPDC018031 TaxID=3365033 RepID=UPI00379C0AFD
MAERDHLEELAGALAQALTLADLGIARAAKKSALSTNTVSAAVNAKRGRPVPSQRTVMRIAQACGADPGPLLTLREKARFQNRLADPADLPAPSGPDWLLTADATEPPERHFNPLRRENLVRSVASALRTVEPVPLTGLRGFDGVGVYALYYVGPHELYRPVSQTSCETPVYVSRSEYGGDRYGRGVVDRRNNPLWQRLTVHRRTLERCADLAPEDFRVRYLLTDDLFIAGAEQLTISDFLPVWNVVLTGFGVHAGGSRRDRVPPWHVVHQGALRSRVTDTPQNTAELSERARRHLAIHGSRRRPERPEVRAASQGYVTGPEEAP